MLPAIVLVPGQVAVIECVPLASDEVLYVATPWLFNVPVPSVVLPSLNVAVPVAAWPLLVVTVAVNVTELP